MKYAVVYYQEENREISVVYYGITDAETALKLYLRDYPENINKPLFVKIYH